MNLPPTSPPPVTLSAPHPALRFRLSGLSWPLLAILAAVVPVAGAFSLHRVFFVRDLAMFFWPRNLWLRRSFLAGEWPLWDPYVSGGQSAVADALNQMFLVPVLAVRMLGTEVVGFNLWVALPFPVAALGAYLFLRARFSAVASSLGAIAFAVSGPVISSGNFPNLSWSVATMPWLLWAVDRCLRVPTRRAVALLAVVFGAQILAGEPVTMCAIAGVALSHAMLNGLPDGYLEGIARWRRACAVLAGLVLGGLLSAIQMVPLASAVNGSWRTAGLSRDFWSLHPLALVEALSVHLTGDYFQQPNFRAVPWMTAVNSGRDPFFHSIYFGTTLLALALFGALAGWRRTWSSFWTAVLVLAVLAASGPYTPFYPFVQAHVPLIGSFRFPVKYLLMAALALSALVASGWDALTSAASGGVASCRRRCARTAAVAFALAVAAVAYSLSLVSLYFPAVAARQYFTLATWLGTADAVQAAQFMLRALPEATTRVVLLALGTALFLFVAAVDRKESRLARTVLFALLVVDLTVSSVGVNPTMDVRLLAAPGWVRTVAAHPGASFYVGGKSEGTLDWHDPDGARVFVRPFDLSPAEGRAALSNEVAFFPAAHRLREVFAYDLPDIWPRVYAAVHQRFLHADEARRARFLANTGVRFRLLPADRASGRQRIYTPRYLAGLGLYDWDSEVAGRVMVVTEALVVPELSRQVDGLFDPAFDARRMVILASEAPRLWGTPGRPAPPAARIVRESSGAVDIEASAPTGSAFLVVLDSFNPDWHVTVDGTPGQILQANAMYRAVRLAPGRHVVEFRYRPKAFYQGAAISGLALLLVAMLCVGRRRKSG